MKALAWAPACILGVIFVVLLSTRQHAESHLGAGVAGMARGSACATMPRMAGQPRMVNMRTSARKHGRWLENMGKGAAALGLAGSMALGNPSLATEFDVLDAAGPTNGYIMDDAPVLQKGSEKKMNEELGYLDVGKGYKLNVVTVRKLEESSDAEALGEKMLEKWNKDKSTSGVLVLVAKGYEAALVGGDKFMAAVGDEAAGSISQDTVSYFASQGRPNQGVSEGVKRITAIINGEADPGPPQLKEYKRERTYKTKEEVEASKGASIQVVGALLLIAFVVPMLQYAGYVQRD
uniref:TPM domain-containing protein n=1 Tax=Lotharella oceanica TaxID=641309 RepID=A0A7S2TUB2_9EUKA